MGLVATASTAMAGESDIRIPDLKQVTFFGGSLTGMNVLMIGLAVCVAATIYGWTHYSQTRTPQVH